MNSLAKLTCPGCSKHCSFGHARCKYGKAYFEKKTEKASSCQNCPKKKKQDSCPKWEAFATRDGLAWKLFSTSKTLKRKLRKGKLSEEKLLKRLSADEQQTLSALLDKLLAEEK